jgi:hypothetical protein
MESDDDFVTLPKKKKEGNNKENDCYTFPEVTGEVPTEFTASKRGRPLLIDPFHYLYHKDKDYKDQTFWRCSRQQSTVLPR